MKGVGSPIEAVPWINGYQISLPPSERSPDYLTTLKQIIEVILDTFVMAYINGIAAKKKVIHHDERRLKESESGGVYAPRYSTIFWDEAYTQATNSLTCYASPMDIE
jgi:hypothetical protein